MNIQIGQVLRPRTIRSYEPIAEGESGLQWMDYAHPDKKKVAVVVLMGFENKDGSGPRVDVNEVLESMGWRRPKK